MDRDADGTSLISDGTGDGLADPPGGIGRELVALGVVELFYRLDQPQIPLLDQIQKEHPTAYIALSDGDHQTEVGLCQPLFAVLAVAHLPLQRLDVLWGQVAHRFQVKFFPFFFFVQVVLRLLLHIGIRILQALPSVQHFLRFAAIGHPLGQLQFFLLGQQGDLANLFQVHPHRVINAEALRHGVGVYLLRLQLLHFPFQVVDLLRGVFIIRLGQLIFGDQGDAQVFQNVIESIQRGAVQLHPVQLHHLVGGQFAILLPSLNQLIQLLRAGDVLRNAILLFLFLCGLGCCCFFLFTHWGSSRFFLLRRREYLYPLSSHASISAF